ncbi:MAG: hypothetical protein ACXVQQ_07165 [Gaiellaceae bacterium]
MAHTHTDLTAAVRAAFAAKLRRKRRAARGRGKIVSRHHGSELRSRERV